MEISTNEYTYDIVFCRYCKKPIQLGREHFTGWHFANMFFDRLTPTLFCPHCSRKLKLKLQGVCWEVK